MIHHDGCLTGAVGKQGLETAKVGTVIEDLCQKVGAVQVVQYRGLPRWTALGFRCMFVETLRETVASIRVEDHDLRSYQAPTNVRLLMDLPRDIHHYQKHCSHYAITGTQVFVDIFDLARNQDRACLSAYG